MFDEGHYRQVEVAAQLKTAHQPKLARQFMQFVLTDEFQQLIPTGNWMYPVTAVALPADFNQGELPARSLSLPEASIARERKAWVQEWLQAVSR